MADLAALVRELLDGPEAPGCECPARRVDLGGVPALRQVCDGTCVAARLREAVREEMGCHGCQRLAETGRVDGWQCLVCGRQS